MAEQIHSSQFTAATPVASRSLWSELQLSQEHKVPELISLPPLTVQLIISQSVPALAGTELNFFMVNCTRLCVCTYHWSRADNAVTFQLLLTQAQGLSCCPQSPPASGGHGGNSWARQPQGTQIIQHQITQHTEEGGHTQLGDTQSRGGHSSSRGTVTRDERCCPAGSWAPAPWWEIHN